MSSTRRTLAAYMGDGTEITYQTAAKWSIAGFTQNTAGEWHLAAHGHSINSVRSRTLATYNRRAHTIDWYVAQLFEATAPVVREYFGHHKVNITSAFFPGRGRVEQRLHGGRSNILKLLRQGAAEISFTPAGTSRVADFQATELISSMRVSIRRCATVGHQRYPASHKISYRYRGEGDLITECVCADCASSYSRRPALTGFQSEVLYPA